MKEGGRESEERAAGVRDADVLRLGTGQDGLAEEDGVDAALGLSEAAESTYHTALASHRTIRLR